MASAAIDAIGPRSCDRHSDRQTGAVRSHHQSGNETVPYVSRFLGEAQITDGHGNVLGRLAYEDGEGIVTADIAPGRIEGDLAPIPEGFWAVDLSPKTLQLWDRLNSLGREYYATTFHLLLDRS